jgi:predicted DNA-binding WGR domain protein
MRRSARVAAAAGATAPPANSTAVQTKYRTKKAPAAKKSAATKRAAPGRGANAIPSAKRKKKGFKGHLDTHAPLGVVDPASNIEGDIFLSPIDDEPLDVMLVLVDPSKNMDKYVVLQLIELDEATSEGQFVVYTRWGRTGTAGQGLEQAFQDADDAFRCFEEKFTGKSGLDWANREDAPVADKYCFMRQNFAAKKRGFADGWEYWVDDGVDGKQTGWYPYDQAGAICTEQLYQESLLNQQHTTRMVSSGAWIYEVNLTSMTQTNATHPNRTIRHIRRVTPGAVMSSGAPIAAQQGAAAHTAPQVPVAVVAGVGAGVRKPTVVKAAVKPQNVIAKPPPAAVMKPASRPVDPDVAARGLMPTDYDVVKADGDDDVWYDSVLNQCDITGSTNSNKVSGANTVNSSCVVFTSVF